MSNTPKIRPSGPGKPKGQLDPGSATSFYAGFELGQKHVEYAILDAGLTDKRSIAESHKTIRSKLGPVLHRLKEHPDHSRKEYSTSTGMAVCSNGDMIACILVERIK